jgi:DNA gyrase subunit A
VTDADEVMLSTTGGILIRTKVAEMRLIGRNTQGVRLIKVEEGDSVSSLARLPEEELAAAAELDALPPPELDGPGAPTANGHIIDDGVGPAEASDHIDDLDADGEPDEA